MPGPRLPALILTDTERAELERLVRRAHGSQALATRARIVLACAEAGATNTAVARELGVCRPSVIEWRGRFAEQRLAGLSDAPRSGAPRTVQDEDVERLLDLAPVLRTSGCATKEHYPYGNITEQVWQEI